MNKPTIYLSGPMAGLPEHNRPAFNAEAARLRALGYKVVNPAELNMPGTEWHMCLRNDLRAMMDCDAVALLPDWYNSKGVHLEIQVAHRISMEIFMASDLIAWL